MRALLGMQPNFLRGFTFIRRDAAWPHKGTQLCALQAKEATPASDECVTELLPIIKLFARLARSRASIGHDLLRVKQPGEQGTAQEAGLDALDLACQVTDALCRMQRPHVELLGGIHLLPRLQSHHQDLAVTSCAIIAACTAKNLHAMHCSTCWSLNKTVMTAYTSVMLSISEPLQKHQVMKRSQWPCT